MKESLSLDLLIAPSMRATIALETKSYLEVKNMYMGIKRVLSLLLCCVLVLGAMPAAGAKAEGGEYRISASMLENKTYRLKNAAYDTLVIEPDVADAHIVLDNVVIADALTISGGYPNVELRSSTVAKAIVLEQAGLEQTVLPMLHADADSHVALVEVQGNLELTADQPGLVDAVQMLSADNLKLYAPVRSLQVRAKAWVQVSADVEELTVSEPAYITIQDFAHVEKFDIKAMELDSAKGEDALYVDTAYQTWINELTCATDAYIGGMGHIEKALADGSAAYLHMDITLTNAQGGQTDTRIDKDGRVEYANSVILPMQMDTQKDLFFLQGGEAQSIKLELLNAYRDSLNVYDANKQLQEPTFSVRVEDDSVASVKIENDQLVVTPAGPGATNIVVTAERDGFGIVKSAFAARVFAVEQGKTVVPLSVTAESEALSVKSTKEVQLSLESNVSDVEYRVTSSNPALLSARIYRDKLLMVGNGVGPVELTLQATKASGANTAYFPAMVKFNVFVLPFYGVQLELQTASLRDVMEAEATRVEIGDVITLTDDAEITVTSSNPELATAVREGNKLIVQTGSVLDGTIGGAATITIAATKPDTPRSDGKAVSYLPDVFKLVAIVERQTIALSIDGSTVVTDKMYDGTNDVTYTLGNVVGLRNGDDVRVEANVKFKDPNVGDGKEITIEYKIVGTDADKYITPPSEKATGRITPRPAQVEIPAVDREYEEGNREVDLWAPKLTGILAGDNVRLTGTALGKMDDDYVGEKKTVRVSGLSLTGSDAKNYEIKWGATRVNILRVQQAPLYITSPDTMVFEEQYTLTSRGGSGGGSVAYHIAGGTGEGRIEGDQLIVTKTGTFIVYVSKSMDRNYDSARSADYTITVMKANQKPLYINSAPGTTIVKLPNYVLTTAGGSGTGAVTYTYEGGTAASGAISGNGVSVSAIGTVLIMAHKAGDDNYLPTDSPVFTLDVALQEQDPLYITSPKQHEFGAPYTMTYGGGNGSGAETYFVMPGGTGVATVSGDQLIITQTGTILIKVQKAGDGYYATAESPLFELTVYKQRQPQYPDPNGLLINSATAQTFNDNGNQYTVTHTGGLGGGAVTYQLLPGGTGIGTLVNNQLTIVQAGTFNLTATIAETQNYESAVSPVHTLTVGPATQSISISSSNTHVYGSPYNITSIKGPGTGAVSYQVVSGGTGLGSISGATLTITKAGTIRLKAIQQADVNYQQAESPVFTLTVAKAQQPILPDPNALRITSTDQWVYGTNYTITHTGGLGTGTVTYSVINGTGIGTLSGATLSISQAGTFTIGASIAADDNYEAIDALAITLTVRKAKQAIEVTGPQFVIFNQPQTITSVVTNIDTPPLSGLPVTYSVVSGNGTIPTGSDQLTGTQFGTVIIRADVAGNVNYEPATSAPYSVEVELQPQPVGALKINPPFTHTFGTNYTITVDTSLVFGTGAITYEIIPGGTGVGTLSGGNGPVLTITKAGTFILRATKAADTQWGRAVSDDVTLTVNKAPQTITITSGANVTYLDPYTITSTNGLGTGALTYEIVSGPATVNPTTGELVTTGAGTVVMKATKAECDNYQEAIATKNLVVNKAQRPSTNQNAIKITDPANMRVGDQLPILTTGGYGGGALTFAIIGGMGNATIVGGTDLLAQHASTVTLQAKMAETADYLEALSEPFIVNIDKGKLTDDLRIIKPDPAVVEFDASGYQLATQGGLSGKPVTYTLVSGPGSISGDRLIPTSIGTFEVVAKMNCNPDYEDLVSPSYFVTVEGYAPTGLSLTVTPDMGNSNNWHYYHKLDSTAQVAPGDAIEYRYEIKRTMNKGSILQDREYNANPGYAYLSGLAQPDGKYTVTVYATSLTTGKVSTLSKDVEVVGKSDAVGQSDFTKRWVMLEAVAPDNLPITSYTFTVKTKTNHNTGLVKGEAHNLDPQIGQCVGDTASNGGDHWILWFNDARKDSGWVPNADIPLVKSNTILAGEQITKIALSYEIPLTSHGPDCLGGDAYIKYSINYQLPQMWEQGDD